MYRLEKSRGRSSSLLWVCRPVVALKKQLWLSKCCIAAVNLSWHSDGHSAQLTCRILEKMILNFQFGWIHFYFKQVVHGCMQFLSQLNLIRVQVVWYQWIYFNRESVEYYFMENILKIVITFLKFHKV